MSSRDLVLNKIRQSCKKECSALPTVPFFHQDSKDLIEEFKKSLLLMGGQMLERGKDDPYEFVKLKLAESKITCSVVPEIKGNRELNAETVPNSLHDVDYGVLRASFGVAETGSICLSERDLLVNTLGYLPQHLIVLLDPKQIVENLHDAYARPEWKQVHYAALHSGPSATADIEGVLIRGAQGVRSLSILLIE